MLSTLIPSMENHEELPCRSNGTLTSVLKTSSALGDVLYFMYQLNDELYKIAKAGAGKNTTWHVWGRKNCCHNYYNKSVR
jgi:hypothetical protein